MSVVIPHRAISTISTAKDVRQAILDVAGDLTGYRLLGERVLIGIYMRPEKTKGGIIRPEMNKEEDVFQGKVGLVLSMGANAFRDLATGDLYEDHAKVGDWVQFFVGDGRQIQINEMPCRVIKDTNIISVLDPPFDPFKVL